MLRCNMEALSRNLRLGLEDLLGDLWHARRSGDLGRLALLSYFEVRRWARLSGQHGLARHSSALVAGFPYGGRDSFLAQVDSLIAHLEQVLSGDDGPYPVSTDLAPPDWHRGGGTARPKGSPATLA